MRTTQISFMVAAALALSACSTPGNLIDKVTGKDEKIILPGKREPALARPGTGSIGLASEPVVIPAAISNSSWAQPGGVPSNVMQNLTLGRNLRVAFKVDAGAGSDSDGRLIASPVVAGGRVYVLDSKAGVRAFSAQNGAPLWARSLVPEGRDGDGAYGGGLATNGAMVFATTAFGEVIALDAASGREIWRQKVSTPIRGAPTVTNGQVYFVTIANETVAVAAQTGTILWKSPGAGEAASAIASSSPAVAGGFVIAPYTNGDVTAFSAGNGSQMWSENLASTSSANSAANLNGIAGRPVIASGSVFAISHAGRLASLKLTTGAENWSHEIAGSQTPWLSGEYLFVISNNKTLAAITRSTGKVRWISDLPAGVWAGPVMGGGRLLAVSSNGQLASISPQTGKLIRTMTPGDRFYIAPVIAGNTIYLLDDGGELIALR